MKRYLTAMALILLSMAADAKPTSTEVPQDLRIVYGERNGSVPPPYHFESKIILTAGGDSKTIHTQGYSGMSGSKVSDKPLQVAPDRLAALYRLIVKRRVFKRSWKLDASDRRLQRVGGGCSYLFVTANGKTVEIPCQVPTELEALKQELVEAVKQVAQAPPAN